MKKIGIIVGTNRPTRIGRGIAEWLQKTMARDDVDFELIDLAEINLPFLDEVEIPAHHHYQKEYTGNWSQLISGFDGFVLVFPQYNWGYPAVLKNALDYLYDEWAGKPVSIVCYGGHGGFQGALAMRLVTQGLNMHTIATNIPLDIDDEMFDEHGQFKDIEAALAPNAFAAKATAAELAHIVVQ